MRRILLLAVLAAVTVPMSIAAGCFDAGSASRETNPQLARQIEQRFAIGFCYGQYRSQTDVLRCLAQAL